MKDGRNRKPRLFAVGLTRKTEAPAVPSPCSVMMALMRRLAVVVIVVSYSIIPAASALPAA